MSSIFTKIINGELPAVKVYEDSKTMAIMDINPIQIGQVLVFPKIEVGSIWELSDQDYLALMATVQKVGQKIKLAFPDKLRVGVMVEGLEVVDHAHVKVFPFSSVSEFHAQPVLRPSQSELEKIANQLSIEYTNNQ
jgi:histidine triad (HIT) family protein